MRYEALDGWRGVAALSVALVHLNFASHIFYVPAVRNAGLFVDLFFVLSGFVMAHTYGARLDGLASAGTFMIRRFGRLYPLHLATLLFLVALESAKVAAIAVLGVSGGEAPFTGQADLGALIANFFLVQAVGPSAPFTWNGPSWSISVEIWTYLVFAGCTIATGARRLAGYVVFAAAGLVLFYATRQGLVLPLGEAMFRCIFAFFVGAALYELAPRGAKLTPSAANALEAAAVLGLLALLSTRSGLHDYLAPLLLALFLWVFASERGAISQAMKSPPMRRLGDYSYSIYMIHYPLLAVIAGSLRAAQQLSGAHLLEPTVVDGSTRDLLVAGGPWLQDALTLVYLAAVVAISSVTFRYIEVPARNWFNAQAARYESGSRKRAAPSASP